MKYLLAILLTSMPLLSCQSGNFVCFKDYEVDLLKSHLSLIEFYLDAIESEPELGHAMICAMKYHVMKSNEILND